ncbi:DnaD domain protein [Phototrophicus methaneseepsis]|uniref:DnaD domain protein n=1 Tax=Phototrophicus methaneseepsis TaxID=2710758 RepID=A0A7S8IGZ5_9CHLR|nr:DnaD domain protein [Phototrophicus methaneseepsis]QPC84658.1 DnaD domain protein [Phototrophicus methaneseepsis]
MSEPFKGFNASKDNVIRVHAQFFTELLPQIDDMAELKLTLYCYHVLHQIDGAYRYLHYSDFRENGAFMGMLEATAPDKDPDELLDETIMKALSRGTLLYVAVELETGPEALYFMNTDKGREAIDQLKSGNWQPDRVRAVEVLPPRLNAFALYEANIGPLTPRIKDEIVDAEEEFSAAWVEDAINQAVQQNVRKWSYVRAVLKRWQQEGKRQDERLSGSGLEDGKRYATGKYADFIDS